MRRNIIGTFVLAASLCAATFAQEFKPIFNGRDLSGWKVPDPNPFWKVADGVLIGENNPEKKGSMLWTEKSYKDVIVELEVRWTDPQIDSGIMVRKPELQLQLGTSASLKKDMTCSFYTGGTERYPEAGQARDIGKVWKQGEWNKVRLQARGNTFTVWANDQKVSQYTNEKYAGAAPIGLQIHANIAMKVEFRNITVAELE